MNTSVLLTELSREILSKKHMLRSPISGVCMYPFLADKDVLMCKSITVPELQIGDVIIYATFNGLMVHRLIRKHRKDDKIILITKGDAYTSFDNPLKEEDVLAKVISIKKNNGSIYLETKIWRLINYIIAVYSLSTGLLFEKLSFFNEKIVKNHRNCLVNLASKIFQFSIFLPLRLFILILQRTLKVKMKNKL